MRRPDLLMIRTDHVAGSDPLAGVIAALGRVADCGQTTVQVSFRPAADRGVGKDLRRMADILALDLPMSLTDVLLSKPWNRLRTVFGPVRRIASGFRLIFVRPDGVAAKPASSWTEPIARKKAVPCFRVSITISHAGDRDAAEKIIAEVASTLSVYDDPTGNRFACGPVRSVRNPSRWRKHEFLLNAIELAALVHIPTSIAVDNLVKADVRTRPPPLDLPAPKNAHDIVIGVTNHRQWRQPIALPAEDRRRHVYILGKTGMGKTTLLETMIAADLAA